MASGDESFDRVYNEENTGDQAETNFDINEQLIVLVRSFPMLWDQSLPDFKNKTQREDIWQLISKMLGRKVTDCTNKWRLIRDKYARELQKRRKMMGSERDNEIKWRFFDEMSFLQKHVKPRKRIRANTKVEIAPMSSSSSLEEPGSVDGYESPIEVEVPFTSLCVTNLDEEEVVSPPMPNDSSDCSSDTDGDVDEDDGFAIKIIAEISETRQAFDGLSRRLGFVTDNNRRTVNHRRIDKLCQLMSDTYMSLPLQLQEEYDIEVLRLLKEYRNKAKLMET